MSSAADYPTEYLRYVHTYINSGLHGNWTYLEKPCFPVMINDSQIMPGQNWTIVCPLVANHSYHAYCYGNWTDTGPDPKTAYDIYVYDPLGQMVGYHTQAAGFLSHLGTNGSAFFVPESSGNYTFVIANDVRESTAAQQATFMIIEDVQTDVWNEHYVDGCGSDNIPMLNTSWGYEFATSSPFVQVYVKVPKTLDMYEARLYLMSVASEKNQTILDGIPLAWEQGLYGATSNGTVVTGGYILDSQQYRGNDYASCEYYGQDMWLNYSTPALKGNQTGMYLYHLVFIGQAGYGTIDYLVKTEFNNTSFNPILTPTLTSPDNDTTLAYASNSTILQSALLEYTTDNWKTEETKDMDISNSTCNATIPKQPAGTVVNYAVTANDTLENSFNANGTYAVKYLSTLNLTCSNLEPALGDNVTFQGYIDPRTASVPIVIYVASANETGQVECLTLQDGSFAASFSPNATGELEVYAKFTGNSSMTECESLPLIIQVGQPMFAKYSLYILMGAVGATAIGFVVYLRKFKG